MKVPRHVVHSSFVLVAKLSEGGIGEIDGVTGTTHALVPHDGFARLIAPRDGDFLAAVRIVVGSRAHEFMRECHDMLDLTIDAKVSTRQVAVGREEGDVTRARISLGTFTAGGRPGICRRWRVGRRNGGGSCRLRLRGRRGWRGRARRRLWCVNLYRRGSGRLSLRFGRRGRSRSLLGGLGERVRPAVLWRRGGSRRGRFLDDGSSGGRRAVRRGRGGGGRRRRGGCGLRSLLVVGADGDGGRNVDRLDDHLGDGVPDDHTLVERRGRDQIEEEG